jgi:ParB family transcriptional regulator, chromosome partitioning protein
MTEEMTQEIEFIPVDLIDVLNPRVRSARSFDQIKDNISTVGLKRPITVARRRQAANVRYDLVCGQGRYEAYLALGEKQIPAVVIEANEHDCLIRSLVENCARRRRGALDLFKDIQRMKIRGYSNTEISTKTGLNYAYVGHISKLFDQGEERLLQAVEAGQIPITVAIEIAESDDAGIQKVLTQAYEKKLLRGRKLMAVKRLIDRRRQLGKAFPNRYPKRQTTLTSHALVKTFQEDVDRKRVLIRKATATRDKLVFAAHALQTLFRDDNFQALLKSEGMNTLPKNLASRIETGAAAVQ